MQSVSPISRSGPADLGIAKFLTAGVAAGITSAVLSNIYNLVREGITDKSFDELNPVSIVLTCLFTAIVGSVFYWFLSRRTIHATRSFQVVSAIFTVFSVLPNLMRADQFGEGFAAASIPLHLIAGIVAIIVIPLVVRRQANH